MLELFVFTLVLGWLSYQIVIFISAKSTTSKYLASGYSLALSLAGEQAAIKITDDFDSYYNFTDHQIHLARAIAQGHDFVSLSIAAHEACHALQDARCNMRYFHLLQGTVKSVKRLAPVLVVIGALSSSRPILAMGYSALLLGILLSLIIITNEFVISFQARALLGPVLRDDDKPFSTAMLFFAALTYITPIY